MDIFVFIAALYNFTGEMFNLFHNCLKATHQQDSSWSWVVCICAAICQMIYMGILRSFGVLFPTLMEEFQSTRERTGKL